MTTKIAISLPDDQVAAARCAVEEGRAASVSSYIAGAIADRSHFDELAALLAEMAAEAGRPTGADRTWARKALGLA